MATIRKTRGKWQAIIRRKGYPASSKTFTRYNDALEWARHMDKVSHKLALLLDID